MRIFLSGDPFSKSDLNCFISCVYRTGFAKMTQNCLISIPQNFLVFKKSGGIFLFETKLTFFFLLIFRYFF